MRKKDRVVLTLANDVTYLPLGQTVVREMARKRGFPDETLYQIDLALEEAVMNVITHAFSPEEEGTFDIICESTPLGLKIVIKEKGMPFDPAVLPEYAPGRDLESVQSAGLGVHLMKKLMDEIHFHNLGSDGKETHLVKHLPARKIEDLCDAAVLKEQRDKAIIREAAGTAAEKIEYGVRAMRPAEAIEVSRGAYISHGYTFFDDHIYYPDKIVKLNETGQLLSAVAVSSDGRFMGHAALFYPEVGARIAELTFAFVNPEYRSQGCMNRLCAFLFDRDRDPRLEGLYAFAVTNHPITQKVMVKYGFTDCGIELATSPASWVFKGIDGVNTQRISVALSYRYMGKPASLTLYPPERHRPLIEKLYAGLGAAHRFRMEPATAKAALPGGPSVIAAKVYESEGCAEIVVERYGADLIRQLKGLVRRLCLKQLSSMTLYLNLEDPLTARLTGEIESLGFFFAGILPRAAIGDALLLQYLNNVELDYDKLVLHTDTAKDLLEYIKQCDPNREV